jgi:hypothetical protein
LDVPLPPVVLTLDDGKLQSGLSGLNELSGDATIDNAPISDAPIEVDRRVYIAGHSVAKQTSLLQRCGITHVLNCSSDRYEHENNSEFTCSVIQLREIGSNMAILRGDSSDFIDQALRSGEHHRVLVHGDSGVSFAPTIVMAWMMVKRNKTLSTAYATVTANKPDACPSHRMFGDLLSIEMILHGTNTMDADERSTEVILKGILSGFQVDREKVLQSVKQYGMEEAQRRLLEELM